MKYWTLVSNNFNASDEIFNGRDENFDGRVEIFTLTVHGGIFYPDGTS